MKKFLPFAIICMATIPAFADSGMRDNYIGIRLTKNENLAFDYNINNAGDISMRSDNFSFSGVVGNRLTDYVRVEFETGYAGASENKRDIDFDFDIWSNMFNAYLFQEFSGVVSPYIGVGLGFATIWADVAGMGDTSIDLSMQIMAGVNFALNDMIDFNVGLKYQNYGTIEHKSNGRTIAETDIDATAVYFGASYKFGL